MKPRNKFEKRAVELSGKLHAISEAQIKWGKEHCFEHTAYRCKDEMWCTECGRMWVDISGKKEGYLVCPYCGRRLEVKVSRKKKLDTSSYVTIVTAIQELQVIRHVYIRKFINSRDQYISFHCEEVCQQWFSESGGETVIAKPMNMYCRGWLYEKPMSVKGNPSYMYGRIYDIDGWVYPKVRLIPVLRRNGLKTSFHGIAPASLIRVLLGGNPMPETLLKTKQYDLLRLYFRKGGIRFRWAVNICNRNGYIVKDASMWEDYLQLLEYFNLDTHNAYYVCPNNLKDEHDKLLKRKNKIEAERRREEQRIARMKRADKLKREISGFISRMQKYFGMEFKGDGIVIHPLESVTQFYQEGKLMHHCVYTNRYYAKPECLILSASVKGKGIETVEVNLNTFKIVQSRAACNGTSKYHDRIIELVNKNMDQIRRRAAV